MAERGGFEPPERIKRSTVFETVPFNRSGISPRGILSQGPVEGKDSYGARRTKKPRPPMRERGPGLFLYPVRSVQGRPAATGGPRVESVTPRQGEVC